MTFLIHTDEQKQLGTTAKISRVLKKENEGGVSQREVGMRGKKLCEARKSIRAVETRQFLPSRFDEYV